MAKLLAHIAWQWVALFLIPGGTALYLQAFIPLSRLPAAEPE